MTGSDARGPVVIDTDVYGADLVPGSELALLYEPVIVGRPAFISFQTAAELRYGALLRGSRRSTVTSQSMRSVSSMSQVWSPQGWAVRSADSVVHRFWQDLSWPDLPGRCKSLETLASECSLPAWA